MNKQHLTYGFVILHYMALEMTMQCVDNLLEKYVNEDIFIIIVDNKSPNGSGTELQKYYENNKQVKVILHDKNDGFARGNNVGFDYLKQNFDIDFMIVMNNDVIIEQKSFFYKISEIYQNYNFDVLGPDIYESEIYKHQNPIGHKPLDNKQCEQKIKEIKKILKKETYNFYKYKILHYAIYIWAKPLIKLILPSIYKKIVNKNNDKKNINGITIVDEKQQIAQENVVLNGACYIFSKRFINNRKYAFHPGTFMYIEEQIITLQCQKDGYKILYHPNVKIKHLCGISSKKVHGNKKLIFMWKQHLKSLNVYMNIYNEYENKYTTCKTSTK